MSDSPYLFTSESVTEGHPDKICDQISDAILDAIIAKETELAQNGYVAPDGQKADPSKIRVACETLVTTGLVMLAGEIRTQAYIDFDEIARGVIRDIGYTRAKFGFDADTCAVINAIHEQSPDIAQGVDDSFEHRNQDEDELDRLGAGDQGMVFGYACDETAQFMPMPIHLAHRLAQGLANLRKDGTLEYLRPDGKTQVTLRYEDGRPAAVQTLLISTQHAENVSTDTIRTDLQKHLIEPLLDEEDIPYVDAELLVNPTGRFVIGGPMGDAGLTGRKTIVDTYGGVGRHGGGGFSGKDCTKVDRSGAYAARWVAKNVVAAGLAKRCEVQVAYAIGVARPLSISIDTFGTEEVDRKRIEAAVEQTFDLRPGAIIRDLDLNRPIYRQTAAYGHFGRDCFPWEQLDRVEELRSAVES
ncbi:MAG: methionine adenosyltransferase [Coriobacteriaceae bacterium]|nr:methionine adenosyltransferase [Coriobacteriaceae bacterium]